MNKNEQKYSMLKEKCGELGRTYKKMYQNNVELYKV